MHSVSTSTDPINIEGVDSDVFKRWFFGFAEELINTSDSAEEVVPENVPGITDTSSTIPIRHFDDALDETKQIDVSDTDCVAENDEEVDSIEVSDTFGRMRRVRIGSATAKRWDKLKTRRDTPNTASKQAKRNVVTYDHI